MLFFFFFQAEDGIRDVAVTGVQTCALPISFSRLDDARRLLEQRVYDHFRKTGEWPRARDFGLDYHDVLDQLGGLEVVCHQIGIERLSCGSPMSEHDRVALRLSALAECQGAEDDVTSFLAAVRLGADRYQASRGRDVQLSGAQL